MSRELTVEECRKKFLDHVRGIAKEWARIGKDSNKSLAEVADGTAFSILVMLDGCSGNMPASRVLTSPHPDDEEYHRNQGENWWPTDCDLSGGLHEGFYVQEDDTDG